MTKREDITRCVSTIKGGSTLERFKDILVICKEPTPVSIVTRKTHIDYYKTCLLIHELEKFGLLSVAEYGRVRKFTTTKKGLEYVIRFNELVRLLSVM